MSVLTPEDSSTQEPNAHDEAFVAGVTPAAAAGSER